MKGFGIDHLPYAVFSLPGGPPRVGVRYGDEVLDLSPLGAVFSQPSLNGFLALGTEAWSATRRKVVDLLGGSPALVHVGEVALHLPVAVGDYVDFYCSEHHATNVGRMFRPDDEPLLPNWRHLPVGYHGRAGTVVVGGTDVVRPEGQLGEARFGPSQRLDIEAELAFVVGTPGSRIPTSAFTDHVFGVALLNDWSARDIQAWEYRPLGPFLGKSFATSLSPWITPLSALEGARCPLPGQSPEPLPYLRVDDPAGYDLDLEVVLNGEVVSRPPYSSTYWSPAQMLAHLTSNGAAVRTGDVFASGTVSGPEELQRGSLLELFVGQRFLQDGDEVTLRARTPDGRVTLGEVSGRVLPTPSGTP